MFCDVPLKIKPSLNPSKRSKLYIPLGKQVIFVYFAIFPKYGRKIKSIVQYRNFRVGKSACKMTYEGGCSAASKSLTKYRDRTYTVQECHGMCLKDNQCGGFFIGNLTKTKCWPYKEGCKNNNDTRWKYYALKNCATNGLCSIITIHFSFTINLIFSLYFNSYPFQTIVRKLVHAKKAAHVSNQKKVYFHARVLKIAKV